MTLLEFLATVIFTTSCVFGSLGIACLLGMVLSWIT